jgi:hypothetical protein
MRDFRDSKAMAHTLRASLAATAGVGQGGASAAMAHKERIRKTHIEQTAPRGSPTSRALLSGIVISGQIMQFLVQGRPSAKIGEPDFQAGPLRSATHWSDSIGCRSGKRR